MKLKSIILLFTLSILFIGEVSAQKKFYFTPKAGINLSYISGTGSSDIKTGLNIGVSAEYMATPKFSVESGLFYSMQGVKMNLATIHLDYVNIPLFAKYYVFKGLNVYAGPQFGFKVRAELDLKEGEAYSVKKDIKPFDPAWAVGVGYQFDFGLSLSAGYSRSFVNHAKDKTNKETSWLEEHRKYYNEVVRVMVGWQF